MGTTFFKGVSNIGETSITEVIEDNLVSYIDWGFLELGAFYNIRIASSGTFGGDRSRLRGVADPRYTNGQVWEGYRQDWIWQSGLSQAPEQPIQISGVYVGSTFYPRGSGYHINYKYGQVIFDNPIATTSIVKLEYPHKWVSVVGAAEVPWFRNEQNRSYRVDDPRFLANSGVWNELAETRLQLPLVAVEVVDATRDGYQLGGGQWSRSQVILHILSEDPQIAKRIASILADQNESTIYVFDPDRLISQNSYPLDYRGEKSATPWGYPQLIAPTGDGGFLDCTAGAGASCPAMHLCPDPGPASGASDCAASCVVNADCRAGEACKWFAEGRGCARTGAGALGATCSSFRDCGVQRTCVDWPGGFCTRAGCTRNSDCESGTSCADVGGVRACALDCSTDMGRCRSGYTCRSITDVSGSSRFVCAP